MADIVISRFVQNGDGWELFDEKHAPTNEHPYDLDGRYVDSRKSIEEAVHEELKLFQYERAFDFQERKGPVRTGDVKRKISSLARFAADCMEKMESDLDFMFGGILLNHLDKLEPSCLVECIDSYVYKMDKACFSEDSGLINVENYDNQVYLYCGRDRIFTNYHHESGKKLVSKVEKALQQAYENPPSPSAKMIIHHFMNKAFETERHKNANTSKKKPAPTR